MKECLHISIAPHSLGEEIRGLFRREEDDLDIPPFQREALQCPADLQQAGDGARIIVRSRHFPERIVMPSDHHRLSLPMILPLICPFEPDDQVALRDVLIRESLDPVRSRLILLSGLSHDSHALQISGQREDGFPDSPA